MNKMTKKTIVFDFDGVIHKGYKGWKDGSIYGEIDYDLLDFIKELMNDYYIVISSNRPAEQIVNFLNSDKRCPFHTKVFKKNLYESLYWTDDSNVGVTNEKAVGIIYIDDRGYRYKGLADLTDNLKKALQESVEEDIQATDTILAELKKKNKIIDAMALQLFGVLIWDDKKEELITLNTAEEVKQYFERKAEDE